MRTAVEQAKVDGPKGRKRYDQEFKIQAVKLLDEGQRTQRALAAELGVSEVTLGAWKRRYGMAVVQARFVGPTGPTKAGRNGGHPVAAAMEMARLKRELDHMTRQRDILKKALSIFSQGQLNASK
jgi:transposase